mmetsp:Transcript_73885/g.233353  ORF Transcript_73885/g.233353 Transcript_73885/m.233353 type:complete len:221 (-) Transcript_73885:34-696(-)
MLAKLAIIGLHCIIMAMGPIMAIGFISSPPPPSPPCPWAMRAAMAAIMGFIIIAMGGGIIGRSPPPGPPAPPPPCAWAIAASMGFIIIIGFIMPIMPPADPGWLSPPMPPMPGDGNGTMLLGGAPPPFGNVPSPAMGGPMPIIPPGEEPPPSAGLKPTGPTGRGPGGNGASPPTPPESWLSVQEPHMAVHLQRSARKVLPAAQATPHPPAGWAWTGRRPA